MNPKDLKTTAYLGLGVMGYPMAGHLASNGYDQGMQGTGVQHVSNVIENCVTEN